MKITLDTIAMYPWHDINRMMSNAKSLTVKAGGRKYEGEATLEDDNGHLTLTFAPRQPKSAVPKWVKTKAKAKK